MKKNLKKVGKTDKSPNYKVEDEIFNERFKRLKYAFGVHSDTDLAKILGISQQAVYAAKQRRRIPSKWLDVALSKNVATQYIMEGDDYELDSLIVQRTGRGVRLNTSPETIIEMKSTGSPTDEKNVVKQLVEYAMRLTGKKIDPSTERIILHNIRRFILPKVVVQIRDEIDELNKIIQNDES